MSVVTKHGFAEIELYVHYERVAQLSKWQCNHVSRASDRNAKGLPFSLIFTVLTYSCRKLHQDIETFVSARNAYWNKHTHTHLNGHIHVEIRVLLWPCLFLFSKWEYRGGFHLCDVCPHCGSVSQTVLAARMGGIWFDLCLCVCNMGRVSSSPGEHNSSSST